MKKQVIFFQGGGGQEDYDADAKLVASLRSKLGAAYSIHYPLLVDEEVPDLGRHKQVGQEIARCEDGVILVGHSLGASMLLAYLSEHRVSKKIAGIFLIATPFWRGNEDWVEAFKLPPDFAEKLDHKIPLFLYHCRDDEVVPFAHFAVYMQELPWASFCELSTGGHQFDNDLTMVAKDIKAI
jgi:predicted alpha/beta hydrolase family esterase